MARRRRSTRGTTQDSFRNYGMATHAQLMQQARDLATASAPTRGSINRQYDRAESDVTGFSTALAEMLRGIDPSGGYDKALSQQRILDDAAAARLAEAGVDAGSIAAQSGMTGAASSALVSQGAAARQWNAQQPAIAHARASTALMGLENAQQDALTQRAEAIRQGTLQAFPQLQQSALARATALASLIQNNRQFGESVRQFNTQQAFNQQQLGEQQRQFDTNLSFQSEQLREQHNQFIAGLVAQNRAAKTKTATKTGPAWAEGFTRTQIRDMQSESYQGARAGITHAGVGPADFIRETVNQGVPQQIATLSMWNAYSPLLKITWNQRNKERHPYKYRAYQGLIEWMWKNWQARPKQPGSGGRRGGR